MVGPTGYDPVTPLCKSGILPIKLQTLAFMIIPIIENGTPGGTRTPIDSNYGTTG